MGRKDKSYRKDLKQQIHEKLTEMLRQGEGTSKKAAINDGSERGKIFSYNTFKTYWKHCKYFANYINQNHPECTTLSSARKYAYEWLQYRTTEVGKDGRFLSAWTIQTEAKAVGKLFGITPDDKDYFTCPKRRRRDIKRSRNETVRDRHFSQKKNSIFINFCQGTGCRRNIIKKLTGDDLWSRNRMLEELDVLRSRGKLTDREMKRKTTIEDALSMFADQDYFLYHRNDKGGRDRLAPIIGPQKSEIIRLMEAVDKDSHVWPKVPENADIHGYRSDYAVALYKLYARDIRDIPFDRVNHGTGNRYQGDVYVCRSDQKGKKLDKPAMLKCSKALGHNRIDVVANNYTRGI